MHQSKDVGVKLANRSVVAEKVSLLRPRALFKSNPVPAEDTSGDGSGRS